MWEVFSAPLVMRECSVEHMCPVLSSSASCSSLCQLLVAGGCWCSCVECQSVGKMWVMLFVRERVGGKTDPFYFASSSTASHTLTF